MSRFFAAMLAVLALTFAPHANAAPKPPAGLQFNNVEGTSPGGGTFSGTVLIERIVSNAGSTQLLRVNGVISGTVTDALGNTHVVESTDFSTLASFVTQGACGILFLDIGPIELNLLGLVVDVSELEVNVAAIPNDGLLGELLCSLAGLLDTGGVIGHTLAQINKILRDVLIVVPAAALD